MPQNVSISYVALLLFQIFWNLKHLSLNRFVFQVSNDHDGSLLRAPCGGYLQLESMPQTRLSSVAVLGLEQDVSCNVSFNPLASEPLHMARSCKTQTQFNRSPHKDCIMKLFGQEIGTRNVASVDFESIFETSFLCSE